MADRPQRRFWLFKSEPGVYSIDDLERDGETCWDGVRNYQARNLMRDEMVVGDLALFYHSNASPPGVAGVARICRDAHPDVTALDPRSGHFDPKASADDPRWWMVDLCFVEKFRELLPLERLRDQRSLAKMPLLQRGQRLSVQPVTRAQFERILRLAGALTSPD